MANYNPPQTQYAELKTPVMPMYEQADAAQVQVPRLTPEEFQHAVAVRRIDFSVGKYLKEGWNFLKLNLCVVLLFQLFCLFVFSTLGWGSFKLLKRLKPDGLFHHHCHDDDDYNDDDCTSSTSSSSSSSGSEVHPDVKEMVIFFGVALALVLVQVFFVFAPLASGFFSSMFGALRTNTRLKFSQFFQAYNTEYFCSLTWFTLVYVVLSSIGYSLWTVPGVYFTTVTLFSLPLHHEHRHLGAWQSLKTSATFAHRYCLKMFLFLLALIALQVVGVLLFGVGLLLTLPWTLYALGFCYHHVIGVAGVAQEQSLTDGAGMDVAASNGFPGPPVEMQTAQPFQVEGV